ncbi:MAG: hypothetical protein LBG16_05325 [Elusimicrobiota bacterium]|jgi:hypothetical protein|nr:hypothetical protein [Elusimicrobiota bacterium]
MAADYSKLIFSGQRRLFFLTLALLLVAQAALFLQSRLQTALGLVSEDFKIAVILNNASAGEAGDFLSALGALDGVKKAREIDPMQAAREGGLNISLSRDLLPRFYELSVNARVMLNPKVWVQDNIAQMQADAAVYYKEEQAKLALYIDGAARLVDILLGAALFAFLAFGFFVEAYYSKIISVRERTGGVLAAAFAFSLACAAVCLLTGPLDKIYPQYAYDILCPRQAALFAAALLAGWTLAKWKRF